MFCGTISGMQLPLSYYGNPILRQKTVPVDEITDEIRRLIKDMQETMHANNGIGLATPQIGLSISLFITEVPILITDDPEKPRWEPGKLRVFINPKIIGYSDEKWVYDEGCLSIPGLHAEVVRPVGVIVRATDQDGKEFEETFSWLDARAIMHENDHINGVLFIDRVHGKAREKLEPKLHEIKQKFSSHS